MSDNAIQFDGDAKSAIDISKWLGWPTEVRGGPFRAGGLTLIKPDGSVYAVAHPTNWIVRTGADEYRVLTVNEYAAQYPGGA